MPCETQEPYRIVLDWGSGRVTAYAEISLIFDGNGPAQFDPDRRAAKNSSGCQQSNVPGTDAEIL
jgi:hypothetical protein